MKYLSKRDLLKIHRELEKNYNINSAILLPSNLEIAIESPKRRVFGRTIFPTVDEKAAVLMRDLIKLHPFADGNKRTGLLATFLFLEQNGRIFKRNINEEIDVSKKADDCSFDVKELTDWIKINTRKKD